MKIYRAQWLLPIHQPPIKDGAVLIDRGIIKDYGKASAILKKFKIPFEDLQEAIIMPGLVNAHTHLEYSCLHQKIKPSEKFLDWLYPMIELKKELQTNEIQVGIKQGITQLQKSGTVLLGEVTNTGLSTSFLKKSGLSGILFFELVGNQTFNIFEKILKNVYSSSSFEIVPACHAPHTVPEKLLIQVKNYLKKIKTPTSLHLAESREEMEWIQNKRGGFSDLIQDSVLKNNSQFGKGKGPVKYLLENRFLNSKTLCVHCVHLSIKEQKLLQRTRAPIAICPRSNLYTGAGKAPIKQLLQNKIMLCIGTDSLASNSDLNLWKEMRMLKKLFPFLSYPTILRMATLHGALALGFGKTHGSIEKGKKADLIWIKTDQKLKNPYSFLIEEDHEIEGKICE